MTATRASSGRRGDGPYGQGDAEADPSTTGPALRRDAARNLASILAAARTTFCEDGVDVGVEVVAQRAGVGVGTLYRRFPTKDSLIEAVVGELLQEVLVAARAALVDEPAAGGFAAFMRAAGQLQADHAGCLGRLWSDSRRSPVRADIESVGRQLLARAQTAGSVRPDLVYEDVAMLHWSVRGVVETTAAVAPDAWRRHLDLLLAAVAPSDRPLRHPPLSASEVDAAIAWRGRSGTR
jgi:AcrR family transcriptional regulator